MPALSDFRRPFDIARHPTLEPEVKRAILASWASDKAAVDSQPGLRRPDGLATHVHVDDVLSALRALDQGDHLTPSHRRKHRAVARRRRRA